MSAGSEPSKPEYQGIIPSGPALRVTVIAVLLTVAVLVIYYNSGAYEQTVNLEATRSWITYHESALSAQWSGDGSGPPGLGAYTGPHRKGVDEHGCLWVTMRRGVDTPQNHEAAVAFLRAVEAAEPPTPIRIEFDWIDDVTFRQVLERSWADADPATVDDWLDHVEEIVKNEGTPPPPGDASAADGGE
jgi:hypothetical protein